MSKEAFYFPHDYDAAQDEKMVAMILDMGWESYGLFWAIVERMYAEGGALQANFKNLSKRFFGVQEATIERIVTDFDLFYFSKGKKVFRSFSVDRRIKIRAEKAEKARESAKKRWYKKDDANAMRTQCERNANAMLERKGKERKEKERKEKGKEKRITTAPGARTMGKSGKEKDISKFRMPFGDFKNCYMASIPADYCEHLLKSNARISAKVKEALRWRVDLKESEKTPAQRAGRRP